MSTRASVTLPRPSAAVAGTAAVPGSKSLTNRALLVAGVADGTSIVRGPLLADDTDRMRELAVAFGAAVDIDGDTWRVTGTGGAVHPIRDEVFVGQSGTTMRFGTAVGARTDRPLRLVGTPDLHARPIGPLTTALRQLGADVADDDGFPPVDVAPATVHGGAVQVAGSSQFHSALLLLGGMLDDELAVVATGSGAFGYVTLTVEVMRAFGAEVAADAAGWRVAGGGYRATDYVVAPDLSGACHVWALALATGGSVTVPRASRGLGQPDAATLEVFAEMGAEVVADGDDVTVRGPERLRAVDVNLTAMPDQLPTLAVLAALADGTSRLRGAAVTRGHETDRIRAMAVELARCGVDVDEHDDGLSVTGGPIATPVTVETSHDHRIAMAFTALAARHGGVTIAGADCVAKTFPGFWETASSLGIDLEHRVA